MEGPGKEGRPRGAAAPVPRALFLLLLGVQGLGSVPGPRCGCAGDLPRRSSLHCCRGCPEGHFLQALCTEPCGNSTCLPCAPGTFLARENHFVTGCVRCQHCDEKFSQVALRNCSAVADTHCGCNPGWFADCLFKPCRESFHCLPYPGSEAPPQPTRMLSTSRDLGRHCPPGRYEHEDDCVSCPTSFLRTCPEPCAAVCGWRQVFWVPVLVASLVALLLLGTVLIYTCHCYRRHKPPVPDKAGTELLTEPQATPLLLSDSAHAPLGPPGSSARACSVQLLVNSWTPGSPQTQEMPGGQVPQSWDQQPSAALGRPLAPLPSPAPPAGSPAAMLQPGPVLYDVMDAVPARRWKEFVRTLGLREAEIEAVEVEVGRFRDQQYEMLKRWRQQQPAGLSAVYAALERMGLGGCAEDLRRRLQRGP